jgi:hypothetical protein
MARESADTQTEDKQGRIIIRIEVNPQAWERIQQMIAHRGMTQLSAISRAMDWFGNQSELVQAAILGHYPQSLQKDIGDLILKEMLKPRKAK